MELTNFLSRLIGAVGTLITGWYVIDPTKQPIFEVILLVVILGFVALIMFYDAWNVFRHLRKTYKQNSPRITADLCEKIKEAGRIAIFSRDISWVTPGNEAEELLMKKAKSGELVLFVQSNTGVAQKLADAGADVKTYKEFSGYKPKARFTILDYEKTGSRVLIGYPSNGYHVIKEFNDSDRAIVDLIETFVQFAEHASKQIKSQAPYR
jgi:hypothetical protein